jgi:peptidoglycan/xylan/chitin deacetylase (PgdA/CDA1 family)
MALGRHFFFAEENISTPVATRPIRTIAFMRKRLKIRQPLSWVSRQVKGAVGWALFASHFYRRLWKNEAVIVVFHRVNDAYPHDPITCSSTVFEAYVRFFARYFEVLSLTELLNRLESGGDLTRTLVITFDDGYHGNATRAAPILEEHGLRACFFVTTSFIGSTYVPWWDRNQNIESEWMTWDQVRQLRAAGHEIGSHTVSHVNLGSTVGDDARREIGGGMKRLAAELGEDSGLFAYPFGGVKNMAAENRPILKELGLRCCVSAYGGTVRKGDDPYRLRRITLSNWLLSPYHFGFELVARRLDKE